MSPELCLMCRPVGGDGAHYSVLWMRCFGGPSVAVQGGRAGTMNVSCIELSVFLSPGISVLPVLPCFHLCWVPAMCCCLMQWL